MQIMTAAYTLTALCLAVSHSIPKSARRYRLPTSGKLSQAKAWNTYKYDKIDSGEGSIAGSKRGGDANANAVELNPPGVLRT